MTKKIREWKLKLRKRRKMELETLWDMIIAYGIASEETLQVVTDINGYNEETLNDVIYSLTGYRDIEQFMESEVKE